MHWKSIRLALSAFYFTLSELLTIDILYRLTDWCTYVIKHYKSKAKFLWRPEIIQY